jgi:DNA-binding XRE family transcriptional regulator
MGSSIKKYPFLPLFVGIIFQNRIIPFRDYKDGSHSIEGPSLKSLRRPQHTALMRMLIEARERAGITQANLAKRLGRGQPFVSKYEKGDRRLEVIEFVEICREIGVPPERLIKKLPPDP